MLQALDEWPDPVAYAALRVVNFVRNSEDTSRKFSIDYLCHAERFLVDREKGTAKNMCEDFFDACQDQESEAHGLKLKQLADASQGLLVGGAINTVTTAV